jgi:ribosomal protein S15P/S13E
MTPLSDRIAQALRSDQAKRLTERAKEFAKDPANRRRLERLRARFAKKP